MPNARPFSTIPPPPGVMPTDTELEQDLQRLIRLKPTPDPSTGLSMLHACMTQRPFPALNSRQT